MLVYFALVEVWFAQVCLVWFGQAWCDLVNFDLAWSIKKKQKIYSLLFLYVANVMFR